MNEGYGGADLLYSAKHPFLLDKRHHHTSLVIQDAHHRIQHNGVRETLTEVHSKFWIIGGKSLVSSIIHSCLVCKRFKYIYMYYAKYLHS